MRANRRRGLTKIEAAVCLTILVVIVGLLVAAVQKSREINRWAGCQNNLRQLVAGCLQYEVANGHYPPGAFSADKPLDQRQSWLVAILPFVGSEGKDQAGPLKLAQCPFAPPSSATSYFGIAGVGADAATLPVEHKRAGMFGYDRRVTRNDFRMDNDASDRLFLAEGCGGGPWAKGGPGTVRGFDPADRPYLADGKPWRGYHPQPELMLAFGNGSVRVALAGFSPEALEWRIGLKDGELLD